MSEIEEAAGAVFGCLMAIVVNGLLCAGVVALGLGVLRLMGCS